MRAQPGLQDVGEGGTWEWTSTPFAQTPGGSAMPGLAATWRADPFVGPNPGPRTLYRREHESEGDAITAFRCVKPVVLP